jgi:hypothetical protein
MSAAFPEAPPNSPRSGKWMGAALLGLLWLIWQVVRIPAFAFLVILEPLVRFILAASALLLVLTALFYRAIGMPHFPFWTMLALGIGSALLLALYYALMRLLSLRAV